MSAATTYRPPRGWLRVGKYLLPVGVKKTDWRPSLAPRAQMAISQLAIGYPQDVRLHGLGDSEAINDTKVACHSAGSVEMSRVAGQQYPESFVAELRQGQSFGRQCSVIGPANLAVRETGFYLDGEVQTSKVPVSRCTLRYWRKRWSADVTSRAWLPPRLRLGARVAVLNARYSHNYFHWLVEILPRLVPLRRLGIEADYYLIDCLRPYQQQALAAVGIKPQQLIQPHCKLLLQADELLLPSFPSPSCLREMGQMLLSGLGVDESKPRRRVFISRRETGTRMLENEAALEQLLAARGFEKHAMECYPLAKQAQLIRDAEIVIAMHGAGLANLIFARPGTQVVEIVPAQRFNYMCYPKRTRLLALQHQLVFAQQRGDKQPLVVALDDVMTALDVAESACAQRLAA